MHTRYSRFLKFIHLGGDVLLLNFSFVLGHFFRFGNIQKLNDQEYLQLLVFVNLLWFLSSQLMSLYDIYRVALVEKIFSQLVKATILHVLLVFALIFMIKGYYYSREQLLFTYIPFVVLISIWRLGFLYFLRVVRASGFNFRRIIIVGAGPVGKHFLRQLQRHAEYGYKFMGFFDDNPDGNSVKELIKGGVGDVKDFCLKNNVDEVYCALPTSASHKIKNLIEFSDEQMIRFKIVPDFKGLLNKQVKIDFYGFLPVLTVRNEPLENVYNRVIKRAFDVAFSMSVMFLVLSWLYPLIAIVIKFSSKGPILFKQERSGLLNQSFACYKFRTMFVDNPSESHQAEKDDPRITRIGKLLRKTSLDELPQFFNVLLGNMSVVGPRPHMLQHTAEYSKIIDQYMVRHLVKPGITGVAQIKGFRGGTQDPGMMQKRVVADVWYIENWSFLLDLKIISITTWNMLKGEDNAY